MSTGSETHDALQPIQHYWRRSRRHQGSRFHGTLMTDRWADVASTSDPLSCRSKYEIVNVVLYTTSSTPRPKSANNICVMGKPVKGEGARWGHCQTLGTMKPAHGIAA